PSRGDSGRHPLDGAERTPRQCACGTRQGFSGTADRVPVDVQGRPARTNRPAQSPGRPADERVESGRRAVQAALDLIMASTREIRRRIRSISSTAQITKAMQMVAASKMRKAQQAAIA